MSVVATQSSSSAPVEVSWSPPSHGANIITGYRIFYSSGQSLLVPPYVTRIMLNFIVSQPESVSIHSESIQRLPSELISVMVTGKFNNEIQGAYRYHIYLFLRCFIGKPTGELCSSTNHEVGTCTVVGITILAVGLFVVLIAGIMFMILLGCWR